MFSTIIVFAQSHQIDSLKNELITAEDSLRVNVLNKLAEAFINESLSLPIGQKDSPLLMAKSCVSESESLSRKMSYNRGIGIALFLSANIKVQYALKNHNNALTDYINALPYLKISGDKSYLSKCFYAIASGCHFVGKLDKSITYYDSAINSFLQKNDAPSPLNVWPIRDIVILTKGIIKMRTALGQKR